MLLEPLHCEWRACATCDGVFSERRPAARHERPTERALPLRHTLHCSYRDDFSSRNASDSSSACPAGDTFGNTRAILPSGSMMNVALSTLMYSRPMNFFGP